MENPYFRLIFAGGTCLAKAHKIVKRMSEDIDFKIQLKNKNLFFTKNQMLKELKKFRTQIMKSLDSLILLIRSSAVRNEGRYLRIELTYPALFIGDNTLRPHLLLEFTFADVRLATNELSINTIIEDTMKIDTLFSPIPIDCISCDETAIEKWVALTRRIAAIERQYHYDDKTLVRHVYDLNAVKQAHQINEIFFKLAKSIVFSDANQFKNQYPEYFKNPVAEISQSLLILRNKKLWEERYQQFTNSMVYDRTDIPDYHAAITSIEYISKMVITTLNYS